MEYAIFKYLWLLVVLPKPAQLVAFVLILIGLWVSGRGKLRGTKDGDVYFGLLILINIIYGLSILLNLFRAEWELYRVFAACNTFTITCVAYMYYYIYKTREIDTERVEKYMFINMNIMLGLCFLYWTIGDKGNIPFVGALSIWDEVIPGVDTTRFVGYLEYSNLTVFMYLYCYAFSVNFLQKRIGKIAAFFTEILYMLPLVAARTRAGIACAAAMMIISILLVKIDVTANFYKKHKSMVWGLGMILLAVCCSVLHEPLLAAFEKVLSYRAGSTSTRMAIYRLSLEKMLSESPLLGCGIKAMIPGWDYPYGSHSTYIGMFYKTGLVGGTLYLLATLVIVVEIIRRKETTSFDILISFTFLALFAFAVLEDLDGANWNIVIFMSLMAMLLKKPCQESC